jgi:3-phenylpropionate/trans-cinnamate dioxygenase ferredoxin reductase component
MADLKSASTPSGRAVVVGAGHAGGSVAAFLRQYGFAGPITLVGEEPVPPYQRPPLSKAWLKGEVDQTALELRPPSFYSQNDIDLRVRTTAEAIDRSSQTVRLSSGTALEYDWLILATGARARRIPFAGAASNTVLELRTAADAETLKESLCAGSRAVIVGGGYIGLEAAASARALGVEVTVIERETRLLARVACETLSTFFEGYHRGRGVDFRLRRFVTSLQHDNGRLTEVILDDGERLPADLLLVGVGAVPNQELAAAAGLPCRDGVLVDNLARTVDPRIYAIGDCTRRPLPLYDGHFRLESVPNAIEQAKQAAAAICGRPAPAPEAPWFWSDQFDLKLQIAGLPVNATQTIVRGDPRAARFAIFHLGADATVRAVEAVNSPPEFMMGRQMIAARTQVAIERLRDPRISMREVARQARESCHV